MNIKNELPQEDIEKIQHYLQDSKKNIERLKQGKKPKRKIKYIIKDNKISFTLFFIILVTSPFLSFVGNRTPNSNYPNLDVIENTMEILESNYTIENGLSVHELLTENTSSELIILSTLTYSILIDTGISLKENSILKRISHIFDIIENDSFRDYNNITKKLPVFYQFLGIYSLFQAFYALQDTIFAFSFTNISRIINTTITDFLKYAIWPYLYAVSENTTVVYLIDQALTLTVLMTYMLLTGNETLMTWDLKEITSGILDRIKNRFYISITKTFYHQYDMDSYIGSGISTSADLIFTTYGLSRTEKFSSGYSFPVSSSYLHQKIINELIDENWLVHETDKLDNMISIENQAFFSMISYLLNLENVGFEIENATTKFLYSEKGFVSSLSDSKVTAESCFYGLITILTKDWALNQNNRELVGEPRPTPSETKYTDETTSINIILVFIIVTSLQNIVRLVKKFKKNHGDQAEI